MTPIGLGSFSNRMSSFQFSSQKLTFSTPPLKMDHDLMLKFQAIKISKTRQFLDKFLFYAFITFTCSFICSTPFWLPHLFSSGKNFLTISLTKLREIIYNPKVLFFLGNLIVVVLIGESKLLAYFSGSGDVYYDEYVDHRRIRNDSNLEVKKEMKTKHFEEDTKRRFLVEDIREVKMEKNDLQGVYDQQLVVLPTEVLKKRADDFIARVNRQRRLEAKLHHLLN